MKQMAILTIEGLSAEIQEVTTMYLTKRENNFFDDFFKAPFMGTVEQMSGSRLMKTDIKEKEKEFEISMDLPGCAKEDIQVELNEGYLTVSAKKVSETEENDANGKFLRKERFEGSAKRSFYVGDYANEENISAAYADGVLKLVIPKEPEPIPEQPKLIAIK